MPFLKTPMHLRRGSKAGCGLARQGRQEGFTLLELLVALAIASAALAVLFRDVTDTLTALDTARHYENALSRARSHLAALEKGGLLTPGTTEGDDGDSFRWRIAIEPLQSIVRSNPGIAVAQPPALLLYRIRVEISWPSEHGNRREVALTTSRIDPRGNE